MKIKHYNDAIDWLTRPKFNGGGSVKNKEVLPKRKPEEELKKRKKKRFEKLKEYLENPEEVEEMLELQDGGLITIGNKKYTKERLDQLNAAAKRKGYEDFQSVPVGKERDNVARDATRRAKGVAEGKGRPGVKKDYQVKTGPKDLASEAYLQRDLKKTKNQSNILNAVRSNKFKTADEIMNALNLEKNVFDKEVNNLFKNVYTQIGDLNKPKKSQARFGVRFLPRDLDEMYEIRNKLGQIKGFESIEQRNIYAQIADAYGQRGETPNRKAFQEATRKAAEFSRVKNEIKRKYPNINLELDHPLDYKTIKGLGKKGDKFLNVTPIDKSINRGFKETLGKAYSTAIQNGDKETILKIERLADDIGLTVGKVRGSKVMDYGTTTLRKSDLGDEIVKNLRQQNIIADKVKTLEKTGELKTRLKDIGLPRAGEKAFKIPKVSKKQIENIQKITKRMAPQLNAKLPIISTMYDVAKSIPGDVGKAKYLSAGFKTLGLAVAPYVAYTTYQDVMAGKNLVEALERNLIGTDIIGGTKDILAMTPEEREARAKVKQEQIAELNIDMPTGFGFIEAPPVQTDMALEEAKQKLDAAKQRVAQERAEDEAGVAALRRQAFDKVIDAATGNRTTAMKLAGGGLLKQAGKRSGPPPEKGPGGLASLEDYARTMME